MVRWSRKIDEVQTQFIFAREREGARARERERGKRSQTPDEVHR
jgi:hypothetical protein